MSTEDRKRLKALMFDYDIKNKDLAAEIGVSPSLISLFFKSKSNMSLDNCNKLMKFFETIKTKEVK